MERIPVSGPSITKREIEYVTDAVTNAWYGNAGMYHERFERAFAAYIGVKHAISLPSCTAAIHLALAAKGIGPGDEVIVPDCTWIATAAPISYLGATPVFSDVARRTWCLDADSFEAAITPRTKAVIAVDLYGGVPEYDRIVAIARRHGIFLLEDAAEAIGSEYRGKKAGSLGDAGVFSFHGSKTMTTGEGGMLVTGDDALASRAMRLRDHGRMPGDKMFWNTEVAYKYKMSSMQAALGLAQLERIDELVQRKREIFGWYVEAFANDATLGELNFEPDGTLNTYWMVTLVYDRRFGLKKDELMSRMSERGIDTRPFFHPLTAIPAYASLPGIATVAAANKVSYDIAARGINLPSGLNMTRALVERVAEGVRASLA